MFLRPASKIGKLCKLMVCMAIFAGFPLRVFASHKPTIQELMIIAIVGLIVGAFGYEALGDLGARRRN